MYADQKVVLEKQIEKRISMNELYELIEQKIKESGYPREISGEAVYNDICDQIEGKENGIYLLLMHKTLCYKYCFASDVRSAEQNDYFNL